MIGVIAPNSDSRVVSEFFELFKTPWEYFRQGHRYDVILCVDDVSFEPGSAKLVVHYADRPLAIDAEESRQAVSHDRPEIRPCNGRSLAFHRTHLSAISAGQSSEEISDLFSYRCDRGGVAIHRMGYDLFAEVAEVLTNGQAPRFAHLPAVELHIALLRDLILGSGLDLIEIPPVPEGYGCIACLTHDIDHPAIRNHRWDATAFGFLYRATAGSLIDFFRGRTPFAYLARNWAAAAKLPFIYAGWAKDIWSGFVERYSGYEQEVCGTYFVIPFRGYPGRDIDGMAPKRRAARYGASDISDTIRRITQVGDEVSLHGIDAWADGESARKELDEVRRFTESAEIGVRMHWLFFDKGSPAVLDRAGASYDSTIGYRETVGFRSGTSQVYKPIGAERLLELPLHVMDTALFYPAYLGYSQEEAESHVGRIVETVCEFGGCVTVNWHDRSLAPERNWESCYRALLDDLKERRAWFATADQVVSWFRLRRSIVFDENTSSASDTVPAKTASSTPRLPSLTFGLRNRTRTARLDDNGTGGDRSPQLAPFTRIQSSDV